jgi:hypothetical protein
MSGSSMRIEHMFDPADPQRLDTRTLAGWIDKLARLDRTVGDAERIDQIRLLEQLKSAAAAAQATVTADFCASQQAAQRAAGVPTELVGRGIAAQVALARRDSPFRAARHVGLAQALVHEMPATLDALRRGLTSEWRATVVARETACLSREHRGTVDRELAGQLGDLGDRQVEAAARTIAYRLDPRAYADRSAASAAERRVTLRPAPDTLTRLGALLPVAQGVAVYASLATAADGRHAEGDPRSRGQIMADTLVERVTGQATGAAVPVEVSLVITDAALLAGVRDRGDESTDEPAHLVGYGPLPADTARALIRDNEATVWLRRLYSHPATGELVAMESRRRLFPQGLRRFLVIRDQFCRTPWCGAPIRQIDHVQPVDAGGVTTDRNGQGLCEACNQAKEAPGWRSRPGAGGSGGEVTTTTPTGHSYRSHAPPAPGQQETALRRGHAFDEQDDPEAVARRLVDPAA